jgi:hypothetical protein
MVLFSANISEAMKGNVLFTPSNSVSRRYNVYEAYLGQYPEEETYWTIWGGWYDNVIEKQVEIYINNMFLVRTDSLQDCCNIENSIYDDTDYGMIYINVPMHTWLYDDVTVNYRKIISFLSGPKNPNNPSDDIINGEHWRVRLEIPKFNVKLSDVINGLVKYSTFDFTLFNDDGYFDELEVPKFINSPAYIRKTWKENPEINDFIQIRTGMVENMQFTDKVMTLSCADLFRSLEESVSIVVKDKFASAEENKDENLPVIYGQVHIPLIEIVKRTDEIPGQYVAGENITNVSAVYDKDGKSVGFTVGSDFIITSSEPNVKSALVSGSPSNRIGQVITDIIAKKTNIQYLNSFWDITETNQYKDTSPFINIAFTGGTIRDAIKSALSSDMVFLIQKNNGLFTLREYGKSYKTFTINNWEITQSPVKSYDDAQNGYFSSCSVLYNYNFTDKEYKNTLLYRENEVEAESKYFKLLRKDFKTYLTNETDAFNLSEKLSNRFSTLHETLKIGIGQDTSEINLLDTVELDATINGRKFSSSTIWIVKEIDPAQDILLLESTIL